MSNLVKLENINRFNGFSELYNQSRPTPPAVIPQIVLRYLESPPEIVVDLGCGTGLSTLIWRDFADTIIGIEPNDDMRGEAVKNITASNITIKKGVSNNTELPPNYADIIAVSQAFHWFDIDSTLAEVFRVLKAGGVFAVFDCDWPPTVDWRVEAAYNALQRKCDKICNAEKNHAVRNDKSAYIQRFSDFGKFRFVKDIACHSAETCNAERMKGIALSQGAVQDAMKLTPQSGITSEIEAFCKLVDERCKGEFEIVFSYRLRIGKK